MLIHMATGHPANVDMAGGGVFILPKKNGPAATPTGLSNDRSRLMALMLWLLKLMFWVAKPSKNWMVNGNHDCTYLISVDH